MIWRLLLALAILSIAPWANAQTAADAEREARAAFEAKRYEDAAALFAKAHTISPAAITKYNEGYSWELAGHASTLR